MKVISSAINFLPLMVALNQPTASILFSFQVEKNCRVTPSYNPKHTEKPRNSSYISFPYSFWKSHRYDL